jgi:acetyl esterase
MPPALIVAAELDPLRDDSIAYAQRLEDDGNYARLICYKGMIHGFFTLPLEFPEKADVFQQIKAHVNQFAI